MDIKPLSHKDVRPFLPQRRPHSHKGENGRVLIVGGSIEYYGASILAALAALTTGVDLAYLVVPECNFDVTRSFYPDFIVRSYPGTFLNAKALPVVEALLPDVDAVIMGMGVSAHLAPDIEGTMAGILGKASHLPVVLDSDGMFVALPKRTEPLVLTPHRGEFEKLYGKPLPETGQELVRVAIAEAEKHRAILLIKGAEDIVVNPAGEVRVNTTGNPGMTVGGTGDVLAGVVGSFLAQKVPAFSAAQLAVFLAGATGDVLFKEKGNGFIATDVALSLSHTMSALASS